MNWPGVPELVLIAIVVLLFFGGSKLKDVMKSFGEGLREFRKATSDLSSDIENAVQAPPQNDRVVDKPRSTLTEEEQSEGPAGT